MHLLQLTESKNRQSPGSRFLRILVFSLLLNWGYCWKILVVHPIYTGSHILSWRSISEYFSQRGHEVHIVRWKDNDVPPLVSKGNVTETMLSMNNSDGHFTLLTREEEASPKLPFEVLYSGGLNLVEYAKLSAEILPLCLYHCETLITNKVLIRNLQKRKFDIAIVDLFGNECSLALMHHFGLPVVGYWSPIFASVQTDYTTASKPPSIVPNTLTMLSNEMNFRQRIFNLLFSICSHIAMQIHFFNINHAVQKYLPKSPEVSSLLGELNGMLINSDHILDYPQLLPPTFLRVGGLHINPRRELPKDLQDWIQSSGEHGVIVFSMGFIFNPEGMPSKVVDSFITAFSRLPQRFLVKMDGRLDHVPPNVKVLKFLPQQDILAHNKTRVFITHCGLKGVSESIYYGVPMLAMPIFVDQADILVRVEGYDILLSLDKDNVTADEIESKLRRLLGEPQFTRNVKKLSIRMREESKDSRERAMDLIDYLIRYKGADYLKVSSRHLNFFQYFSIDTLALLLFCILAFTYAQFKIAIFFYNKFYVMVRKSDVAPHAPSFGQDLVELSKHKLH